MKASNFEFRYRWLLLSAIFGGSFALYWTHDDNITHAALLWLSARLGPPWLSAAAFHAVFVVGALIGLLAAMLRTWAAAYLDSSVVHDQRLHSARLVADGPYRHLRNPLYLGTIMLAFAFAPMASRIGAVVMAAGVITFCYRLIGREEAELLAKQAESFRQYCEAVPRMIPALKARVPASGAKARWGQAIAGEGMMWAFSVALSAFAWTFSLRVFGYIMVVAFAVSMIVNRSVWRKQKARAAGSG